MFTKSFIVPAAAFFSGVNALNNCQAICDATAECKKSVCNAGVCSDLKRLRPTSAPCDDVKTTYMSPLVGCISKPEDVGCGDSVPIRIPRIEEKAQDYIRAPEGYYRTYVYMSTARPGKTADMFPIVSPVEQKADNCSAVCKSLNGCQRSVCNQGRCSDLYRITTTTNKCDDVYTTYKVYDLGCVNMEPLKCDEKPEEAKFGETKLEFGLRAPEGLYMVDLYQKAGKASRSSFIVHPKFKQANHNPLPVHPVVRKATTYRPKQQKPSTDTCSAICSSVFGCRTSTCDAKTRECSNLALIEKLAPGRFNPNNVEMENAPISMKAVSCSESPVPAIKAADKNYQLATITTPAGKIWVQLTCGKGPKLTTNPFCASGKSKNILTQAKPFIVGMLDSEFKYTAKDYLN